MTFHTSLLCTIILTPWPSLVPPHTCFSSFSSPLALVLLSWLLFVCLVNPVSWTKVAYRTENERLCIGTWAIYKWLHHWRKRLSLPWHPINYRFLEMDSHEAPSTFWQSFTTKLSEGLIQENHSCSEFKIIVTLLCPQRLNFTTLHPFLHLLDLLCPCLHFSELWRWRHRSHI